METPNNEAGRLTEDIMAKLHARFPGVFTETALHNRVYSIVLETLMTNPFLRVTKGPRDHRAEIIERKCQVIQTAHELENGKCSCGSGKKFKYCHGFNPLEGVKV